MKLYRLIFDTGNTYENSWKEVDWNIELGFFSSLEKAQSFISSIILFMRKCEEERKEVRKLLSKAYLNPDLSQEYYNKNIEPLELKYQKSKLSKEFLREEFYAIIPVTLNDIIDKEFSGNIYDYNSR